MARKILVEIEAQGDLEVEKLIEKLRKSGLKARILPRSPEEAVKAIRERWRRLGRRARLGELKDTSLEDEFND